MAADLGPGLPPDAARRLVDALRSRHGATVVLVYGSRARGQGRADSDLDVLALCAGEVTATRDSRPWEGAWLDAFIASPRGSRGAAGAGLPELRAAVGRLTRS